MRALITGITGFAGQYLTEYLVRAGDQVIGSTYLDRWSEDVAPEVREQVALFEWNLAEPLPEDAADLVREFAPNCIYHLAALSVPADCGSAEPSSLAWSVNVDGTRAVIELAQALPEPVRVLAISSAHVYAPVPPDDPIVTEDSPLGPVGAYGKTKLAAEQVCWRAIDHGVDVIVVRAFQHAGPRQLPRFMLPEWAQQFARPGDQPIEVVTLDSYVDLSDVRDVVRAYRLLAVGDPTRRVYNVGSGKSVHGRDVFEILVRLSGRHRDVIERKPGVRRQAIADISRLVHDTGWAPEIPLEQTVADTFTDFQKRIGRES